jgi:hypothetical protein
MERTLKEFQKKAVKVEKRIERLLPGSGLRLGFTSTDPPFFNKLYRAIIRKPLHQNFLEDSIRISMMNYRQDVPARTDRNLSI